MPAPRLMAVSQLIYHNHPNEVLNPRNIRQLMQACLINFIPPPDPRRLKPVQTNEPEEALIDCDKFIKALNESLAQYKQKLIQLQNDPSQIPGMKPLYFPGYIQNFKGKQYNSDDLSGVLCQYQLSYRDIDSIISSRDEEEEDDTDEDDSNDDSRDEDDDDVVAAGSNNNSDYDQSSTDNIKPKKQKNLNNASRSPTRGAVKAKKPPKKR